MKLERKVIVISRVPEKLDKIKQMIETKTTIEKLVFYTTDSKEALLSVPLDQETPYLLITGSILEGHIDGEKLIKKALERNPNGTSVLVTSMNANHADYVVETTGAEDGGTEKLFEIISKYFGMKKWFFY